MSNRITTCPVCGTWTGPRDGDGSSFGYQTCPECLEVIEAMEQVHEATERMKRAAEDRAFRVYQSRQQFQKAANS